MYRAEVEDVFFEYLGQKLWLCKLYLLYFFFNLKISVFCVWHHLLA